MEEGSNKNKKSLENPNGAKKRKQAGIDMSKIPQCLLDEGYEQEAESLPKALKMEDFPIPGIFVIWNSF